MSVQERAYAAAIFIIIGICCIGAYVAISGFLNSNSDGLDFFGQALTPATPRLGIVIPTETPAPPSATPLPTIPPTETPVGFIPSVTPATTPVQDAGQAPTPTLDLLPTALNATPGTEMPTPTPSASPTLELDQPTAPPAPTAVSACGLPFCPRPLGPPDAALAPTGRPCPDNYLWGLVLDESGEGIPGLKVRFRDPGGGGDDAVTKGAPDPPGRYDVPTGAGGTWTLQLLDPSGNALSPVVRMQAHQAYTGGGSCPTRVDFRKQ